MKENRTPIRDFSRITINQKLLLVPLMHKVHESRNKNDREFLRIAVCTFQGAIPLAYEASTIQLFKTICCKHLYYLRNFHTIGIQPSEVLIAF